MRIAKLVKRKEVIMKNMILYINEFDDGIITIMESETSGGRIVAELKNNKLYGKGSKMYREEILEAIKTFESNN